MLFVVKNIEFYHEEHEEHEGRLILKIQNHPNQLQLGDGKPGNELPGYRQTFLPDYFGTWLIVFLKSAYGFLRPRYLRAGVPSVDHQIGPCHKRRFVRGEENRSVGDFLGSAKAFHRHQ